MRFTLQVQNVVRQIARNVPANEAATPFGRDGDVRHRVVPDVDTNSFRNYPTWSIAEEKVPDGATVKRAGGRFFGSGALMYVTD